MTAGSSPTLAKVCGAPGGTVTHVPAPTSWLSSPMVNRTLPDLPLSASATLEQGSAHPGPETLEPRTWCPLSLAMLPYHVRNASVLELVALGALGTNLPPDHRPGNWFRYFPDLRGDCWPGRRRHCGGFVSRHRHGCQMWPGWFVFPLDGSPHRVAESSTEAQSTGKRERHPSRSPPSARRGRRSTDERGRRKSVHHHPRDHELIVGRRSRSVISSPWRGNGPRDIACWRPAVRGLRVWWA